YRIVGNCIGGMLAIEVARQLRTSGREVGALVLMDTAAPLPANPLDRRSRSRTLRVTEQRLAYFRRRLSHHRKQMRELTWPDKVRYAVDRVNAVTSTTAADANRQTFRDALREHWPAVYSDPVQFIVSRGFASPETIKRWSQVLTGQVEWHEAPGDHDEYIRVH